MTRARRFEATTYLKFEELSLFEKILKFLNWSSSAKPQINLNTELYEQLRPFRLPLILDAVPMNKRNK